MRREFIVRVIGTLLVVSYLHYNILATYFRQYLTFEYDRKC